MPDDDDSQQSEQIDIDDGMLQDLLTDALQHGDHDQLLTLTRDLLKQWPLQRIRNSREWRILAALSQVGSDGRRFGLAAVEISRKVALTARLSFYRTSNDYDMVCRTVALSAFEDLSEQQVLKCLMLDGPIGHYAASRLGNAAYRQRNVAILEHCIKRVRNCDEQMERMVDKRIELALLECYYSILTNQTPDTENLLRLWQETTGEYRERYFHTINTLLDPEDLLELQVG